MMNFSQRKALLDDKTLLVQSKTQYASSELYKKEYKTHFAWTKNQIAKNNSEPKIDIIFFCRIEWFFVWEAGLSY